eukprot:SAG22_NODE_317_length_12513_cov_41.467214_15_plen_98_part_00
MLDPKMPGSDGIIGQIHKQLTGPDHTGSFPTGMLGDAVQPTIEYIKAKAGTIGNTNTAWWPFSTSLPAFLVAVFRCRSLRLNQLTVLTEDRLLLCSN